VVSSVSYLPLCQLAKENDLMLRITAFDSPSQALTLRLEGQIIGRWVGELKKSWEELHANGDGVVLDLVDVSFIDADGLALLGDLTHQKVSLVNASPFITELLKGAGLW
jgi:anti-anti-sigma regulatory factor